MYSGTLIADLRSSLAKEESPPETPVELKSKWDVFSYFTIKSPYFILSAPQFLVIFYFVKAPVESKADLRSKIVAEFVVRKTEVFHSYF